MSLESLMKELLMVFFMLTYFLIAFSLKVERLMKYLRITAYFTLFMLLTYIAYKVISTVLQYIFE